MVRFRVHIDRSSAIVYGLYLKLLGSPHHILTPLILAAYDPISCGLPSLYIRSEFEGCFFKTHPLIGGDGRQTLKTVQYKGSPLLEYNPHYCFTLLQPSVPLVWNNCPKPPIMAVPFTYHAKAQSTFKPPLIANENAFLGDVQSRYLFNLVFNHDRYCH
jgi:hypothetical protein